MEIKYFTMNGTFSIQGSDSARFPFAKVVKIKLIQAVARRCRISLRQFHLMLNYSVYIGCEMLQLVIP